MKRRTWWIIIALVGTTLCLVVLGVTAASRAKDFQTAALRGKDRAAAAAASLSAKDPKASIAQFDEASEAFRESKALLGPEWAVGALKAVPWVGSQVGAADHLVSIGIAGSVAGKEIATMIADAPTADAGSASLGSMLKSARPHLDAALVALTTVADHSAGLTDQGLVAPLADAVRSAKEILDPLDPVLQRSHSMLRLERFFLETPRRILLVSQNSAELRPTGGFIGSYGLIQVGPDGVALEKYEDVYTLKDSPRKVPAPAGATMSGRYLQFRDANWWIDYPTSARMLLQFWQDLEQPPVDGIVAVDAVAMSELLGVFGPITVKDVPGPGDETFDMTFTADNLLDRLITIVEVQMGPTGEPRKEVLGLLANELTDRMMAMKMEDLLDTTTALGKSANEKHLQLYFTDPETQEAVDEAGWAGAVAIPDGTTDLLAVTNAMIRASKANIGVRKTIDYQVGLAGDGSADTTLTLGYSNKDPQVEGILRRWFGNYLRVYRLPGTQQQSIPGTPAADGMVTDELGLPAVTRAFRVHRGQAREEVIRTTVPDAVRAGRAAVTPGSPVARGNAAPPSTSADRVSHYRLLVIRQTDLEEVPTTVAVSLPAGWRVSDTIAWKRTTGEVLPVSSDGGSVTLAAPLDGDVILDVEMTQE